jgi:rSAM/selenodomain-associated transferase 1
VNARTGPPSPIGRIVIAMMASAGRPAGQDRLGAGLTPDQLAALRAALFDDTVRVIRRVRNVVHAVVCEPAAACVDVRGRVPRTTAVVSQGDGDLGSRLLMACRGFLSMGARSVVLVGADVPDLPADRLREAVALLAERTPRVVLGPADDGGCYLVGLTECHPTLFAGIDWGTSRALHQLLTRIPSLGLEAALLARWATVDTRAAVERVVARRTRAARHTRAWMHRLRLESSIEGPRRRGSARRARHAIQA